MNTQGKFIIIIGPSASGKTSLVEALVKEIPNSARLITITTRSPRTGEKDGVDFFFISREEFERRLVADEFFEHADVYGNFYGSSKKVLDSFRKKYSYVFAVIDVAGAATLRSKIPDAVTIFIRPGNLGDVTRRLMAERKEMSSEELAKRKARAEYELSLAHTFNHIVENREGFFDTTVSTVRGIIEK